VMRAAVGPARALLDEFVEFVTAQTAT
jgi:hypothetical protein